MVPEDGIAVDDGAGAIVQIDRRPDAEWRADVENRVVPDLRTVAGVDDAPDPIVTRPPDVVNPVSAHDIVRGPPSVPVVDLDAPAGHVGDITLLDEIVVRLNVERVREVSGISATVNDEMLKLVAADDARGGRSDHDGGRAAA